MVLRRGTTVKAPCGHRNDASVPAVSRSVLVLAILFANISDVESTTEFHGVLLQYVDLSSERKCADRSESQMLGPPFDRNFELGGIAGARRKSI